MKNTYYINTFLEKLSKPTSSGTGTDFFRVIQKICSRIKPKNILEIGFHCGHSASAFLFASDATITSCDPCNHKWVSREKADNSIQIINSEFPNRLTFLQVSSFSQEFFDAIKGKKFDLCFIDGIHESNGPKNDLETAIMAGVKYIIIDDYSLNNTNTVPQSVHLLQLHGILKKVELIRYENHNNKNSNDVVSKYNILAFCEVC